MNPSLVKSMLSPPVSSDVKEMVDIQAAEMDSSSEVNGGRNAPAVVPAMDATSLGIELDDLTLDVLLVSLRF